MLENDQSQDATQQPKHANPVPPLDKKHEQDLAAAHEKVLWKTRIRTRDYKAFIKSEEALQKATKSYMQLVSKGSKELCALLMKNEKIQQ